MDSKNRLEHILHCLVEYRKLWLLPAILGLVLATGYAFFIKSETWTSRQTMIIRDDLLGQTFKPGQFLSEEAMKSAQETVLETARRPEVIRATLEKIGPSRKSLLGLGGVPAGWPSHSTIEDFRGSITFESANGGEFGKSDVIVLAAKTSNPDRSVKFLSMLMKEIDTRLSEVRASQFESMDSELQATCESAMSTRSELEDRIKAMDASFGTNISTVQSMNERSAGSPSAFDNKLNEIRADRRKAMSEVDSLRLMKQGLESSSSSDELPTSRELLASQPALLDLVSGLSKAKAELSGLESRLGESHPLLTEGRENVALMKRQIIDAIPATVRGIDGQISVLEGRISMLDGAMAENADLLKKISSKRVPYAALSRDLEKQTENYSDASARLAQMKSRKDASKSIQLLTPIGEPWVGTRSDGLGKRMLSLVGGIAGLIVGLGLVMIVAPPFVDPNETLSAAETLPAAEAPTVSEERLDSRTARNAVQESQSALAPLSPVESPAGRIPAPTAPMVSTPSPVVAAVAPVAAAAAVVASQVKQPAAPVAPAPSPAEPIPTQLVQIPDPAVAPPEVAQPPLEVAAREGNPVPSMPIPTSPAEAIENVMAESPIPDSPSPPVVAQSSQQSELAAPPMPRPASKTLAAIFANMPQPKTDITLPMLPDSTVGSSDTSETIDMKIEALSKELSSGSNNPTPVVRQTETIMLDDSEMTPNDSLLPQRRTVVARPVDLARVDENAGAEDDPDAELSRESIDSAFSQLEPAQSTTTATKQPLSEDIQNIFREDS